MILESFVAVLVGVPIGAALVLAPALIASRRRYRRACRALLEQCNDWDRYRGQPRARSY